MTRLLLSALVAGASALWAPAAAPEAPLEPRLKDSDRSFWAFTAPVLPKIPRTKNSTWARNPVDAFILAKLEEKGLTPSKPADSLSLLRRVTFDLAGLPPTEEEIDRFLKESAARPDEAYESLVDRLLASPHYGERWGQHWLDVVRYAESNGYEIDAERPSAWRYRDYVVQSLNEDKPFDSFVREQVAGDLLAAGKDTRANANLWVATGLHRCGPIHIVSGNVDAEENRNEVLTEMVMGVGSALLGLTMNYARCHDHKFDPISQADYYRLEAFFAATRPKDVDFSTAEERSAHQLKLLSTMAKLAPIKAKVAALDAPYQVKIAARKQAGLEQKYRDALAVDKKKRTPEQEKLANDAQTLIKVTWDEILAELTTQDRERRAKLRTEQHAIEAELPMPPSQAWAVVEESKTPPTYVLKRGEVKTKGAIVEPAFPRILIDPEAGPGKQQAERLTRKNLADWLVSGDQPLTARVFVNRLWQHHFGHGIVATPNDFGNRGARPTHPELLDWLAAEFVRSGWKIKHLHRLMVMSATYRQSSKSAEPDRKSIDPDNKLLWRMNRRRLEGEIIRDSILAAAGTLNREMGGPMVRVPLEPEVYDLIFTEGEPDGLWPVTTDARQHTRRSIYLFAKRNVRQPLLEAFDQPDRLTSCGDRAVSTFAPQALILMNGPLAQAQSRAMAGSLVRQNAGDPDKWIEETFRRCFGRPPTDDERGAGRTFLREQADSVRSRLRSGPQASVPDNLPADADVAAAAALADYCLALFNANEFVYVP
jgi:hypothetical protein